MKPLFNNKKGDIFIISLVILTLLAFSTLAYYIQVNKSTRAEGILIGEQALALTNLYKETQNEKFYVESSAKLSQIETLKILSENAGYPKESSCKKLQKPFSTEALAIFNSDCPEFDPETSYKSQLESQLKLYLNNYKSLSYYKESNKKHLDEISSYFNNKFEIINNTIFTEIATNNTKFLEIEDNQIIKDSNILTFKPKKYPIEYSTNDSFYEYKMIISLSSPTLQLEQFTKLHTALESCKENMKTCEKTIKGSFPTAEVKFKSEYPNYLYINTKTNPEIKLLFNETNELPKYSAKAVFK